MQRRFWSNRTKKRPLPDLPSYHGRSTRENVICSTTTQGILESLINPNTMEVIHYWPSHRERVRRLVKVE
jgi:hypothetical protein